MLCYWDSAKIDKPPDMNAFWNMWKTVIDKYGGDANAYENSTSRTCQRDRPHLAVQQLAHAISDRPRTG